MEKYVIKNLFSHQKIGILSYKFHIMCFNMRSFHLYYPGQPIIAIGLCS